MKRLLARCAPRIVVGCVGLLLAVKLANAQTPNSGLSPSIQPSAACDQLQRELDEYRAVHQSCLDAHKNDPPGPETNEICSYSACQPYHSYVYGAKGRALAQKIASCEARADAQNGAFQAASDTLTNLLSSAPTAPIASQAGISAFDQQQQSLSVIGDDSSSNMSMSDDVQKLANSGAASAPDSDQDIQSLTAEAENSVSPDAPNPANPNASASAASTAGPTQTAPTAVPLPAPLMTPPPGTSSDGSSLGDASVLSSLQSSGGSCSPAPPLTVVPTLTTPPALPTGYASSPWSALCTPNGDDKIGQPPQIGASAQGQNQEFPENPVWDLFTEKAIYGPKYFNSLTGKWYTDPEFRDEWTGGGVEGFENETPP
jgi:hypothetical protein